MGCQVTAGVTPKGRSRPGYLMEFATVQNSVSVSPLVIRKYGTPGKLFGMAHVPGSFQIIHRSLVGWVLSFT